MKLDMLLPHAANWLRKSDTMLRLPKINGDLTGNCLQRGVEPEYDDE